MEGQGQPVPEQVKAPEKQAASRATVAHVAAGKFDHAESVTSLPTEVSRDAFDALNKQNMAQRLVHEAGQREHAQQNGTPYSRDAHMIGWSSYAATELGGRLAAPGVANIVRDKLNIPITGDIQTDGKIIQQYLAGDFYKQFCGTDMPEVLAKTLNVNDMMLLKPFLTNFMLGSEEAFDGLITLRTAIDTVDQANREPNFKKLVEQEIGSPLTPDDKKRLGLFQQWHAIKDEDLQAIQKHVRQTAAEPQQQAQARDEEDEKDEALSAIAGAETETNSIIGVGLSESQGRRAEMEDAHVVEQNLGGKANRSFYAIYDGHGGREVADKAATRLHQNLIEQLDTNHVSPTEALRAAYAATDKSMREEKTPGGATALTALIEGNKLYIANLGDARAVMIHGNGETERLSHDRKANDPSEQQEILDRGGTISQNRVVGTTDAEGRVSLLAVSAALGDYDYQGLRKDPDIREVELNSTDRWVILACDGVWDVIQDNEVAGIIGGETDPQEVSRLLLQEAYDRHSGDNLSVIALAVGEAPKPAAAAQEPQPEPIAPTTPPASAETAAELLAATEPAIIPEEPQPAPAA